MPPLLVSLIFSKMVEGVPFIARPLMKGIKRAVDASFTNGELQTHFGFVERHLGEHRWFAGDALTAADIQMIYPVAAGPERAGFTAKSPPNIARWLKQARARPAYQRALDKGWAAVRVSGGSGAA